MNKTTSRRLFVRNSAIALSGLALLKPSISHAFTVDCPFEGYNPYAESITDLRTGGGTSVIVRGAVYKEDGITPVKNAMIEVWHLSPDSFRYRHRSKLQSDEKGEYSFVTDYPNREGGKSARIYFKISHLGNTRFTQLILTSSGPQITSEHWEENCHLTDKLFPIQEESINKFQIQFNLSI